MYEIDSEAGVLSTSPQKLKIRCYHDGLWHKSQQCKIDPFYVKLMIIVWSQYIHQPCYVLYMNSRVEFMAQTEAQCLQYVC